MQMHLTKYQLAKISSLLTVLVSEGLGEEANGQNLNPLVIENNAVEISPSLSSKLNGDLTEIPRSIDIISAKTITEQGARSLQEAAYYIPGVYAGGFGVDSRLDLIQFRGTTPLRMQDGFLLHRNFYNTTRPEVYTLGSIEFIKGPASVLFGQGALGGIVNSNTKGPQAASFHEFNVTYGSHDFRQIGLDSTGSVSEDESLLLRFVGLYRKTGTEVDYVDEETYNFAPSLKWNISDTTNLTFIANIQKNKNGSTLQFLPINDPSYDASGIDSSTFAGDSDFDKYDTENIALTLLFDHQFNEVFRLSAGVKYSTSDSEYQYLQPLAPTAAMALGFPDPALLGFVHPSLAGLDNYVYRTGYKVEKSLDYFGSNIQLKADFDTGGLEHKLQLGIDFYHARTEDGRVFDPVFGPAGFSGAFYYGDLINLATRHVVPFEAPPALVGSQNPPLGQFRNEEIDQIGVFVNDVVKYDNWIFSAGLRFDHVDQQHFVGGPDTMSQRNKKLSFDAGIMYQFDGGFTPYYSYAQSFEPNAPQYHAVAGEYTLIDPRMGDQHEIGFKYLTQDRKTYIRGAYFQIDERNRTTSHAGIPDTFDAKIKGAEIGMTHRAGDFLMQASYTYIDSKDPLTGLYIANTAAHVGNIWVGYSPTSGPLEKFKAGLGYRYASGTYSESNAFRADGISVFDGMIGYEFENFDLQLNVANIFDDEYVVAYGDSSGLFSGAWGPRRSIHLSLKYKF